MTTKNTDAKALRFLAKVAEKNGLYVQAEELREMARSRNKNPKKGALQTQPAVIHSGNVFIVNGIAFKLNEYSCGYCKFEGVVSETSDYTRCPNCGAL